MTLLIRTPLGDRADGLAGTTLASQRSWSRVAERAAEVPVTWLAALELSVATLVVSLLGLPYLLVLVWAAAMGLVYGYDALRGEPAWWRHAVLVAPTALALGGAAAFFLGVALEPRTLVVGVAALSVASALVQLAGEQARRASGHRAIRTVIVGPREHVEWMIADLENRGGEHVAVTGVCLTDAHRSGPEPAQLTLSAAIQPQIPVLDGVAAVPFAVRATGAEAVIALPWSGLGPTELRRLAWELEPAGAVLEVATGLLDAAPGRLCLTHAGAAQLIAVHSPQSHEIRRVLKDAGERVLAAAALVLVAPLLVTLIVMVRSDGGPAIFRQRRVGLRGKQFTLLKLRTMHPNAEEQLGELSDRNDADGVLFKLYDDPRLTRFGTFLRKYSLDELPQLWNVLRGDMSLVGPRPALPSEVAAYGFDTRRRLAVKPGLTGLWQVSGRSNLSWREAQRLDLKYVDNWSLAMDCSIVARTVKAVIGHQGAY